MARVLIVEDEPDIVSHIERWLRRDQHTVLAAASPRAALDSAQEFQPEIWIIDIVLDSTKGDSINDGLALLKHLRESNVRTPIMMLSATALNAVKVLAFQMGADDYITKPFSYEELAARVHAILRRSHLDDGEERIQAFGRMRIDFSRLEVVCGSNTARLTPTECRILETMTRRPKMVFSRESLIDRAWSEDADGDVRVVDNHIAALRRKLRRVEPGLEGFVDTVHGVGYRIDPELPCLIRAQGGEAAVHGGGSDTHEPR